MCLTCYEEHAYNRRALPPLRGGAPRRNSEENISAQHPEACQDARLPSSHGNPRRTRGSRCTPAQGTQGSERLVFGLGVSPACDRVSTIKSSREIDRIFQQATRVAHPLIILLVSATPEGRDQSGRVAFVAGKKLGNAVYRNRCKRVLRAALRRVGGPWPGSDIAIIARPGVGEAMALAVDSAMSNVASRARLIR